MRFKLIDRIIEQDAEHLVALKNVTLAEEYLGDHFPGFPVLPGVLMLEALVQAGRELAANHPNTDAGPASHLVLEEVKNVRYGQIVQPGQCLRVEVKIRKQDPAGWELEGVGRVGDQIAVQGRFRLAPQPESAHPPAAPAC